MGMTKTSLNLLLLAGLWLLAGLSALLMLVHLLMVIYAPSGSWHWPRIRKVTVREFVLDPRSAYATIVTGKNVRAEKEAFPSTPDDSAEPPASNPDPVDTHRVTAQDLEQDDPENLLDSSIILSQDERKGLEVGDQLWVLDNYFRSTFRPQQFRLTPARLVVEFPEPLLILALALIFGMRKRQAKAVKAEADAPRARVVLKDDFHQRAEQHKD